MGQVTTGTLGKHRAVRPGNPKSVMLYRIISDGSVHSKLITGERLLVMPRELVLNFRKKLEKNGAISQVSILSR